MLSEKERALLGDREAQEAITARGELLPCPFCGKTVAHVGTVAEHEKVNPEIPGFDWLSSHYDVVCAFLSGGCGASSKTRESIDGAIREWNHRPPLLTPTQMALLGIARETRKFEEGIK